MVSENFLYGVLIALLQLLVGFAFSVAAVYVGISLLDRLTRGMKGWEKIKKGNVAVGILYAAVIFSLVWMIKPSIESMASFDTSAGSIMYGFAAHGLILVINLLIAVLSIYILLRLIDMMTVDVNEFKEITSGNVSMALITGSALVAVSFVVSAILGYFIRVLTMT